LTSGDPSGCLEAVRAYSVLNHCRYIDYGIVVTGPCTATSDVATSGYAD
jgi:hypothetical protein